MSGFTMRHYLLKKGGFIHYEYPLIICTLNTFSIKTKKTGKY